MYIQRWHGWCHMKLLSSRRVLCTPYKNTPCHFMQSHIHKVHACLPVTCQEHFWQNDRDLLHATAVTRGKNGYRNKSQHRKLTLEKIIFSPLLQGFEPATFQLRVRRSNHFPTSLPLKDQDWGKSVEISSKLSYLISGQEYRDSEVVDCQGKVNGTLPRWTNSLPAIQI